MRKSWDTVLLAILAVGAGWAYWELHDFGSGSRAWLWLLMCAGFFSLFLLPLVGWRYSRVKLGIYAAFLLSAVLFTVIPTTSRDFFVRDLQSLTPGMTFDEAQSAMNQYANRSHSNDVAGSEEWLPGEFSGADRMVSFRHSDDGAYNADIGEVYFRDGRVMGTRFLAD